MSAIGDLRRLDWLSQWCGPEWSRTLGKLVQFDKRGRHPKARPLVTGNAQIVLFTGVRYERDVTPVPGKPVNRPKRKRG